MSREVILKVFSNVEDAELAQQFLASNGIASLIRVDPTGGQQVSSHQSLSILLMVNEHFLDQAQEILQLVR